MRTGFLVSWDLVAGWSGQFVLNKLFRFTKRVSGFRTSSVFWLYRTGIDVCRRVVEAGTVRTRDAGSLPLGLLELLAYTDPEWLPLRSLRVFGLHVCLLTRLLLEEVPLVAKLRIALVSEFDELACDGDVLLEFSKTRIQLAHGLAVHQGVRKTSHLLGLRHSTFGETLSGHNLIPDVPHHIVTRY